MSEPLDEKYHTIPKEQIKDHNPDEHSGSGSSIPPNQSESVANEILVTLREEIKTSITKPTEETVIDPSIILTRSDLTTFLWAMSEGHNLYLIKDVINSHLALLDITGYKPDKAPIEPTVPVIKRENKKVVETVEWLYDIFID